MNLARRSVLFAVPAFVLGSCQDAPPRAALADITFAHKSKLRFEAARMEIVSNYRAPMAAPNIEHLQPISPEAALRRWAQDRIVVSGGDVDRYVKVTVLDAALKSTPLPRTQGVRGMFTNDQVERFDIALATTVELRRVRGDFREGGAEAQSSRFRTIVDGLTLNQRDAEIHALIEQGMADIDERLERQIREGLGRFLIL
jgi:hypothetical protein